jgi:taurine--2-oxoglutarate transaminase
LSAANSNWESLELERDYFVTWTRQSDAATLAVERAEEDEFILSDGRRVFDFLSTSFQASFGHSQAAIIQRIKQQLDEMPIASPKATFALKQRVSRRLLRYLAVERGKLFYTVSGAESVENALKIARHATGRTRVLARHRSYHGATLGAMSVSGDWRGQGHVGFSAGTVRIPEPYEDPSGEQTRRIVSDTGPDSIAALIVEPISGVNGVILPPRDWWRSIQSLCREFQILLICDEVLDGFGRTQTDFAFHQFGVQPDLVTMSKAITGGYIPFGAVWVDEPIARQYDRQTLACGLTNYAHPLGLAALEGVLDLLETPAFQQHRRQVQEQFAAWLTRLKQLEGVEEIRSSGCLAAIELTAAAPTWQQMIDRGVYAYSKGNLLVLAPPLTSDLARLSAAATRIESLLMPQATLA